ncbi:autophagy-related protein 7 [Monoraphidium neglectum]|uniref:Ubiquitin-like modifier-activating enzyme ATG7 n=1 Tax=Monoraphidium neglectum TaxID=145388 RepID=A0A0D2LUI1_9CHLO|nr:autophagy-related protein 7 [Monoraphidium neglectum]KIY95304.1 autophagy-related protein 7 [Monoraphidium neglectum]|eukprot:XP_013894324.1 autophagy-related protein 7 [Monoraphidium neglectum]
MVSMRCMPRGAAMQGAHELPGDLLNVNTIEGFRNADKRALLQQAGARIWRDIVSGAAEASPELLSRFLVLTFGDLKRYEFTYWFAFPALKPPAPFQQLAARPLAECLDAEAVAAACDAWRGLAPADPACPPAAPAGRSPPPFFLLRLGGAGGPAAEAVPLSSWREASASADTSTPLAGSSAGAAAPSDGAGGGGAARLLVAVADPSQIPLAPGWPLRNLLLLAAARWRARALSVLCIRDGKGRLDAQRSFIIDVALPEVPEGWCCGGDGGAAAPDAVGWEANTQGKLAARRVDVSAMMSPVALADQAVDLNLRLMRWRAAPALDIAALAATKCLLLGAGTLGCAVARTLLAWGVRDITFVDSGRVAFSNPVRQSLFTFQDCLGGGRPKAEAAAEAVQLIFPSARARGVALSIPMPGHPPADRGAAEVRASEDVAALDDLVAAHDVVFLLTDSRESRWLPALLAAARRKLAITAALGFDGFVVMRHGAPAAAAEGTEQQQQQQEQQQAQQQQPRPAGGGRLGCYFCNDVVAPVNSAVDRSLDQQCTVARPGLAPIAGALAVELMAALLQHPLGVDAPSAAGGESAAALGPVPHMLRGQLSGFSQVSMEGRAFSQCTACSDAVVALWRARGAAFVMEALRRPGMLEEVTGLAELHRQAAAAAEARAAALEAAAAEEGGGVGGGGDDGEGDEWTEL